MEGTCVSSSLSVIYAAMARVLVSSVLTMTHMEGSYLSVLMVCSHGHSALLQGFRGGSYLEVSAALLAVSGLSLPRKWLYYQNTAWSSDLKHCDRTLK